MSNKNEIVTALCILALMVVVSVTLLTSFRTCELRLSNGTVIEKSCIMVMDGR